ncbi:hypothetical protein [Candidatus Magnetominusculus xianensis]|uniref:Uncharacterized protein n=1 Tax=Candidatus Magnetominusculus xianensis TaxID=1748249 RepID=A0ABR5SCK0_9BACT|nr:hypothetical protein [Candidatus Magnetominusculus xianensis]KWT81132.1 hypothetical protein ASN18_2638 [Candidatus Magnetominusculus xianensis]MBF0402962.1 hypothetical protein [Nitrospirota bacterium]
MEPENYQVNGICSPEFFDTSISVSESDDGEEVTVSVPLIKDSYDDESYPVIVYLQPEDRDEVDCLMCTPACDEYTDESESPLDFPTQNDVGCISECIPQVRWWENYETHHMMVMGSDGIYTANEYKKSKNTLTTQLKMPNICSLDGVGIRFEVSTCKYDWMFGGEGGEIPDDGSLKRVWEWVTKAGLTYPANPVSATITATDKTVQCGVDFEAIGISRGDSVQLYGSKKYTGNYTVASVSGGTLTFKDMTADDSAKTEEAKIQIIRAERRNQYLSVEWDFTTNKTCFYPGERIYVYGYIKNTLGDCKPLLIGIGKFETRCYTSGLFKGYGLVEKEKHLIQNQEVDLGRTSYVSLGQTNIRGLKVKSKGGKEYKEGVDYASDGTEGAIKKLAGGEISAWGDLTRWVLVDYEYYSLNVSDGGEGQELKDSYIGNDKLMGMVLYEGQKYWIDLSDFSDYEIGKRVLIYKNAPSTFKDRIQDRKYACRQRDQRSGEQKSEDKLEYDDVISDNCVTYKLSEGSDKIVPERYYAY